MKTRAEIVTEAKRIRAECLQIFTDAEYWNERNPHEVPVAPDPEGEMQRIIDAIDHMLAKEPGGGGES